VNAVCQSADGAAGDLRVDAIVQTLVDIRFDHLLVGHHADIVIHLLLQGQDDGFTLFIELRTTCTTKDLLNIEDTDIFILSRLGIIHLRALNHDCIGRQVYTPSKGSSRDKDLDVTFHEELLNNVPVFSE
jgi:hypothetical protein